jgi:hypothetical protein
MIRHIFAELQASPARAAFADGGVKVARTGSGNEEERPERRRGREPSRRARLTALRRFSFHDTPQFPAIERS